MLSRITWSLWREWTIVAPCVKASRACRNDTRDLHRACQPSLPQVQNYIGSGLFHRLDFSGIIRRSSFQSSNSAAHNKLTACGKFHPAGFYSDSQNCHRYALADIHLDRYRNDGDAFLQHIGAIGETWLKSLN